MKLSADKVEEFTELEIKALNLLLEDGADEHNKKEAFELLIWLVRQSYTPAMHMVGYCFDVGEGVAKDAEQALRWYKRAWHSERHSMTCINIALLYEKAGTPRQARFWWNRAINMGDGEAALSRAEVLLERKSKGWQKKVNQLLSFAVLSRAISPGSREDALALLRNRTPMYM